MKKKLISEVLFGLLTPRIDMIPILKWLIIVIVSLTACSRQAVRQFPKEVDVDKVELSEKTVDASCDTLIRVPESPGVSIHIYKDYICKLYFKDNSTPMSFEVWNMDNNRQLYRYDTQRDNLLFPIGTWSNSHLTINDSVSEKILLFNIDDAVKAKDYIPEKKSSHISSTRIIPWNNRLAFLNDYSYKDNIQRICFTNRNWIYKEKHKYDFNSANVIHGELISNNSNSKAAYVPDNNNTIEILDSGGNKEVLIQLYHETRQEIASFDLNGTTIYAFKSPAVECFSSACGGFNTFVAGYIDDDRNHSIVVFDWEGHLLGIFKVGGEIKDLSYSEDEKNIYAFERIDNFYYLIKYSVPLI